MWVFFRMKKRVKKNSVKKIITSSGEKFYLLIFKNQLKNIKISPAVQQVVTAVEITGKKKT